MVVDAATDAAASAVAAIAVVYKINEMKSRGNKDCARQSGLNE